MSEANDQTFVLSLLKAFFKSGRRIKALKAIKEESITGWEKWLQIEFATFLREHTEIKAWGREAIYGLDRRVAKSRTACSVDFIIHQRGKHSHIAVEFKQSRRVTACVQGMLKDLQKLEKIKGSEYDIRSVWCVGIHDLAEPLAVQNLVNFLSVKNKVSLGKTKPHTEKIGTAGYSFTII